MTVTENSLTYPLVTFLAPYSDVGSCQGTLDSIETWYLTGFSCSQHVTVDSVTSQGVTRSYHLTVPNQDIVLSELQLANRVPVGFHRTDQTLSL